MSTTEEFDDRPVTEAELSKAHDFVRARLQPDLSAAQQGLDKVRIQKEQYQGFLDHLVDVRQRMHRNTEQEQFVHSSLVLDNGLEVPTR